MKLRVNVPQPCSCENRAGSCIGEANADPTRAKDRKDDVTVLEAETVKVSTICSRAKVPRRDNR